MRMSARRSECISRSGEQPHAVAANRISVIFGYIVSFRLHVPCVPAWLVHESRGKEHSPMAAETSRTSAGDPCGRVADLSAPIRSTVHAPTPDERSVPRGVPNQARHSRTRRASSPQKPRVRSPSARRPGRTIVHNSGSPPSRRRARPVWALRHGIGTGHLTQTVRER